jgi:hypothetical protein
MVNRLSDEQLSVLEHVARYRLTLPSILANTKILSNARVATATATIARLVDGGWLGASPLSPGHGDVPYFHLTAKGAKRLGHDPQFGGPLPRDTRIDCFAIATFCCGSDVFRQLLTKEEFQEKFRALWFPGQPVRYCLERGAGSGARLCFLKVDRDGVGRWDRLIDSCDRFLRKRTDARTVSAQHRAAVEAFGELVQRGQFQFTVLTALADKKRAIELEVERRADDEPVPPIRVHVVPGLFGLLFPGMTEPVGEST